MQHTTTDTGLQVSACLLDRVYEVGRKCSKTFRAIKDRFIRHDEILGEWNYVDANRLLFGISAHKMGSLIAQ